MPCIGIGPGIAGLILGIMGLKHRQLHPETKGAVHAWIGIILGGGMTLVWAAGIALMIFAAMQSPN